VAVARLGGDAAVEPEPLRTAAALLAGYRARPESPNELARLGGALSSLLSDKGQLSGLTETLTPLLGLRHLGKRRLLVSGGAGAELSALNGAEGTAVLQVELRPLKPLLERSLPNVEYVFTDFLQSSFGSGYDGVVVIPPLGHQLIGRQLSKFELSKRGGKARPRVSAELLYMEHALAATAAGGLLVTILSEGLLSSAGHADFRAWLLKHARLLAVISLPMGACFKGTGVRCSVVLLMKSAPPEDYPIIMLDAESDDLSADIASARSRIDEFLDREVPACA
jgi:hypothetical protein